MEQTPTFTNPPIVEFVLGVQFSPLTKMTSGHFGRFWDVLGDDWNSPRDEPQIQDQSERFNDTASVSGRFKLKLGPAPLINRFTLINRAEDRLLQLQPSRLHLNWRKTNDLKPSYKDLIGEFEEMFAKFTQFCIDQDLGEPITNQWELTYIDCFPRGEYWETPADWGKFLPGLFGVTSLPCDKRLNLERRAAEWSFEIVPKLGRLHFSAVLGQRSASNIEALMLNSTARGPISPDITATLREGLDLGHQVAVDQFLALVHEDTKKSWGTQNV